LGRGYANFRELCTGEVRRNHLVGNTGSGTTRITKITEYLVECGNCRFSESEGRMVMKPKEEVVGRRIRRHREARGLSQRELASRINRHPNTLWVIENNQGYPSAHVLLDIAEALNVPVAELIEGTTFMRKVSPRMAELLELPAEVVVER
jgi:DNA-binding XRE family transcriptional regulator